MEKHSVMDADTDADGGRSENRDLTSDMDPDADEDVDSDAEADRGAYTEVDADVGRGRTDGLYVLDIAVGAIKGRLRREAEGLA